MMSQQRVYPAHPRYVRGLSLIEILVAMTLGLVVLAGATNLFLGSSRTFGVNESLSRMQEDARFAMTRLERDVRGAGHTGCAPNVVNQIDDDDLLWADVSGTVMGWENTGTGIGDTLDVTNATNIWVSSSGRALPDNINPIAGSDVLEVSSGKTLSEIVPNIITISNNQSNINLDGVQLNRGAGTVLSIIAGNCARGDRFRRTNSANANSVNTQGGNITPSNRNFDLTNTYDHTANLVLHSTSVYFIGAGTDGVPALMMRDPTLDEPVTLELVRGVDSMQVLYGVAPSQNSTEARRYVTAEDVGATQWDNVVSVRLSLLLRSVQPVNTGEPNRRLYNLLGTTVNPTRGSVEAPTGDQNIRVVFTKTMSVRNRLQ